MKKQTMVNKMWHRYEMYRNSLEKTTFKEDAIVYYHKAHAVLECLYEKDEISTEEWNWQTALLYDYKTKITRG